ncbi:MAG: ATP-binding protein [Prevotella sp.]|nr:ATP-binding protein [Prevotella sp.]
MIDNPFITYGYESAAYFCDREEETRQLISLLTNGNHTALISPRRIGKTGLLHHCFAQPEIEDSYFTFLIDIYATKNLQDMVYQMGQSIVKRLKSKGRSFIDTFLLYVTSLRTGISFDGRGNASWNVNIGDIKSPAFTLDEIFNYLQSADKRCIVAIDEFQSLVNYPEKNTEALLRTYIQQCRNAIFVFSGSQQSLMNEMFSSPSRPFYQSVSMLFLHPVNVQKYDDFAKGLFSRYQKTLGDGVLSYIYKRYDGVTWYIQKMLNQLFAETAIGSEASLDDIMRSEQRILSQNEESYKDTLFQLTIKQRNLFIAIAQEEKATKITGSQFMKRHHLTSASSVQKAAEVLTAKQLLTCHHGIYEIYDKFMAKWIQNELS